jgi:hypothetical protein
MMRRNSDLLVPLVATSDLLELKIDDQHNGVDGKDEPPTRLETNLPHR